MRKKRKKAKNDSNRRRPVMLCTTQPYSCLACAVMTTVAPCVRALATRAACLGGADAAHTPHFNKTALHNVATTQRQQMPKHSKNDDAGSDDGAVVEKKQSKKDKKEKTRERSRSSSPAGNDAAAPEASEGGQMLDCQDCQQKWEFTADERAFFEEKGFSIPIRCGPCRKIRKQQKEGGGGGGGGGGRGGRGGFGGGGGDRGSGCFNCGEEGHRFAHED
jgi:uncharacterized membrane protein YgcG